MFAYASDHMQDQANRVLILGLLVGVFGGLLWWVVFASTRPKLANRGGLTFMVLGVVSLIVSTFVMTPRYHRQTQVDAKSAEQQYQADVASGVSKQVREDHYARAVIHLCYPNLGEVRMVDSSRGEIVLGTSVESASYFIRYRIIDGRFVVTPHNSSSCKEVSS